MRTLDLAQLSTVVGGRTLTRRPDGSFSYSQTNYETCLDAVERRAQTRYPDNRTFLGRWFGTRDPNAAPRADWIRTNVPDACGPPPAS